jgi:hypothetical protein
MNCWVAPGVIEALPGLTLIVTSTAGVTSICELPFIPDIVATTVVLPGLIPVATPLDVIVATVVSIALHPAAPVMSWLLPSVKTPVAVNCWLVPEAIEGLWGVTSIETSAAGATVNIDDPDIVPEVATMLVVPELVLVASPCVPEALLMVAAPTFVELHCADAVTSC